MINTYLHLYFLVTFKILYAGLFLSSQYACWCKDFLFLHLLMKMPCKRVHDPHHIHEELIIIYLEAGYHRMKQKSGEWTGTKDQTLVMTGKLKDCVTSTYIVVMCQNICANIQNFTLSLVYTIVCVSDTLCGGKHFKHWHCVVAAKFSNWLVPCHQSLLILYMFTFYIAVTCTVVAISQFHLVPHLCYPVICCVKSLETNF